MNSRKIIDYWRLSARHSFVTMKGLFSLGRYSDALFFGHIVLEKALKALVVEKTGKHAPLIHDLLKLNEISGVKLFEDERLLLKTINSFNIGARYPDYRLSFYKMCDFCYTKDKLDKIIVLYEKLCLKMKSKE